MERGDYRGREQAFVKHFVLQHYLEQLAFKVLQASGGGTLNYIDGFSGPWDSVKDDHRDASPAIALKKLEQVKRELAVRQPGLPVTVRGFFVESDPAAFSKLELLLGRFGTAKTHAQYGKFESHID